MKLFLASIALALLTFTPSLVAQQAARPRVANPVVVQFIVDGIDANTVKTAVANGATTVGMLLKEGVTARSRSTTLPARTSRSTPARISSNPGTSTTSS